MTETEKIEALRTVAKPDLCEIVAVYWDSETTSYYSWARYSDLIQYSDLSLQPVEARLVGEPFKQLELNGDVESESVNIVFDDIDKEISAKFKEFGTVPAEVFIYYPQVDYLKPIWFGQLNKPLVGGYKLAQTTLSNGFRSRELLFPKRTHPKQCTGIFGGKFTNAIDLESNGCQYDRHLGGTMGLLDGDGNPFTDCARLSEDDCIEKFGHARNYLGFNVRANGVVSDPHTGYIATSKNNASTLKYPIKVVYGRKILRGLNNLAWRAQPPDYVAGLWEVAEGRVRRIWNITLNGAPSKPEHTEIRWGGRGQDPTAYDQSLNFSGTAFFRALFGEPNSKAANNYTGTQLEAACFCEGFDEIAVFTDEETYTRTYTENLAWVILDAHTNQKFGFGYSFSRFNIQPFIDAAAWAGVSTTFTHPDGTEYPNTPGETRASISVALEGRPSHDQIRDLCRTGRISVPFQDSGKYSITPIAAVSEEALENARVFSDSGDNKNIIFSEGVPSIQFSQTPDDQLANHIVLTFQESINNDTERPITVDDPDQKRRAGIAMGENNFQEVPKRYAAVGHRALNESIKLAFSFLWFGELDTGGIKNNLRGEFTTTLEQILDVKRYDVIKIESELLEYYESPEGNPFQYFRVLKLQKGTDNKVRVTVQAYNEAAYANFEVESLPAPVSDIDYATTPVCRLEFDEEPYYENGSIVIPAITTC